MSMNISVGADVTGVAAGAGFNRSNGSKARQLLKAQLGEDVYSSWFKSLEFDGIDGTTLKTSVAVKFLRNWIQTHYMHVLLECCRAEFDGVERIDVAVRTPGASGVVKPTAEARLGEATNAGPEAQLRTPAPAQRLPQRLPQLPAGRTMAGGLEGSPLDPRYTLDSFVVGSSNRMAHAGAVQVAETVMAGERGFNPLYMHASVGLGKTHLLHAIAWEVKRRNPSAQVLYLTAERFRYQFVDALRSEDPLSFKERFRQIDMLLIDDLEFMHGQATEQEFDHIINALLDGGKQVVVASARPPHHIERLNERMRSRLSRGLVTEIGSLEPELREQVLERRLGEKRLVDPTFEISKDVIKLLAERLTESGRELEGAITRLHASWQYMRTPITLEIAETVIRDLVQGIEPRRIKIEDIIKVVSRHFGISRGDLLSQRRHRSVVWPRQIGMYLSKSLTSRSLPEIGRRFGNRDHTTVLHAIRKIESSIPSNPRLKDELEELKRMLAP
jgi:chromosomal replication initiator protein